MKSGDGKPAARTPADTQSADLHEKRPPEQAEDKSGAPRRGTGDEAKPVRIDREAAQKNLPPDPDPDDPASP